MYFGHGIVRLPISHVGPPALPIQSTGSMPNHPSTILNKPTVSVLFLVPTIVKNVAKTAPIANAFVKYGKNKTV